MISNWKAATLWAVILWVIIFAEVSIVMFTPAFAGNDIAQKIIHLIALPFIVLMCSYMYFRDLKKKPAIKDGIFLGIYFLAIGTVLDLLITVPLFTGFSEFYSQWNLWLGFAEVLVFTSVTAWWIGKK